MIDDTNTVACLDRISAETRGRLEDLVALLTKWNRAINLVAPGTLDDSWQRHVADSAQLFDHAPRAARTWLDLGSGGGFPGLVVAVLAQELAPELKVELVDSDQRKCVFLQTAAQTLGLDLLVTRARIEALAPRSADVVSARALARLSQLCAYALPHLAPQGVCLFLKGAAFQDEVAEARTAYRFDLATFPSLTDSLGVVVQVSGLSHV